MKLKMKLESKLEMKRNKTKVRKKKSEKKRKEETPNYPIERKKMLIRVIEFYFSSYITTC
jgi:hypothetical protein